ncbi:hypothetical protein ACJW31_01G312400 [Castanea mollissima]
MLQMMWVKHVLAVPFGKPGEIIVLPSLLSSVGVFPSTDRVVEDDCVSGLVTPLAWKFSLDLVNKSVLLRLSHHFTKNCLLYNIGSHIAIKISKELYIYWRRVI